MAQQRADRIQRNPEVIAAKVGQEYVVLSPVIGEYFALSRAAGRVWELLAEPRDRESLGAILIGEFRVDSRVLDTDLSHLIEDLTEKMLIQKL